MKLSVQKKALWPVLERAARLADKKSSLAILANVVLYAKNDRLVVSATDLYLSTAGVAACDIDTAGSVCVSASNFAQFVKSMPDTEIKLVVGKNHRIELSAGKVKFRIPGMPAEDFPPLPTTTHEFTDIDVKTLARVLTSARYASSSDDTRPHLNGVLVRTVHEKSEEGFWLLGAATDGHRLAVSKAPIAFRMVGDLLLPLKGIAELLAFAEGASTIGLVADGGSLYAKNGDARFSMKLVAEAFPPFEKVIPATHEQYAILDRELLTNAVKRVALAASDRSGGIRLKFTPEELTVESEHPDVGEAAEGVTCVYSGEPLAIGVNARYLSEALAVLREKEVRLEFTGELGPILMRGAESHDQVATIMPMRI